MSTSNTLSFGLVFNTAIALVDGRTADAKDMLRALPSTVGAQTLVARLDRAIEAQVADRVRQVLLEILQNSMRVEAPADIDRDVWYQGVHQVESLIEQELEKAKKQLTAQNPEDTLSVS